VKSKKKVAFRVIKEIKSSGKKVVLSAQTTQQCARDYAGIAFKINSGYRTIAHNKRVGGVANSPHLGGYAADIHCVDDASRWVIVNALIQAGFTRIGIAKTFIHVDNDPSKNEYRIWTY
jgi:uncharacterized protein YcbK (DUF882 family)